MHEQGGTTVGSWSAAPRRRRTVAAVVVGLVGTIVPMIAPVPARANAYAVTLSASDPTPDIGTTVQLTATATPTTQGTGYGVTIYDQGTGEQLAYCGVGGDCFAYVTENVPGTHTYIAFVSTWEPTFPPQNVQATSNPVSVTWSVPTQVDAGTYGYGAPLAGTITWDGGLGHPACTTTPGVVTATAPAFVVDGTGTGYAGVADIAIEFRPFACESLLFPAVSYGWMVLRATGTNALGSTVTCHLEGMYSREVTFFGGNSSGVCTINGYTTDVHWGGVAANFVPDATTFPTHAGAITGYVAL